MRSPRRCLSILLATTVVGGCEPNTPYRIGVVLDRDGVRGAAIAAGQVNSAGGIRGRPLELRVIQRGGVRAKVAIEAADSLASDASILAVVGHTNSAASLAASQIYNARGLVQIAPTSTTPLFSQAGPFSFRLVASDIHQGAYIARQVLAQVPARRTAVLFVNDEYGRPLRAQVIKELAAAGRPPVYEAPYAEGASVGDGEELVSALVHSRVEQLVWVGRWADYIAISEALVRRIPGITVIGSDGLSGLPDEVAAHERQARLQYVHLVDFQHPNAALAQFGEAFTRAGYGEPREQSVLAHDAVLLLAEAFRIAGRDRRRIRDWLSEVGRAGPSFAGASGRIAFTADGDRSQQYFLEHATPLVRPGVAPRE